MSEKELLSYGINPKTIDTILKENSREAAWIKISKTLLKPAHPFTLHQLLFSLVYPDWLEHPETAPLYLPQKECVAETHIATCMREFNFNTYQEFHQWSYSAYEKFWKMLIDKLQIVFKKNPEAICDISFGVENPQWLKNAKMNIVDSCFLANPDKTAILFLDDKNTQQKISYSELNHLSNRVANSLIKQSIKPGEAIAIDMPMSLNAVAIYLGIIKMGGIVISIADSFSAEEIATRLSIGKAKAVFTEEYIIRQTKKIPLYEKVIAANAPKTILLTSAAKTNLTLREIDLTWDDFLVLEETFNTYAGDPQSPINILFSSGTTGTPKAIPWNHTTPIKVASDAYFHQNIEESDVLLWPTNLGWMMGPWVLFAALINQATLALYTDVPKDKAFGQFIENAKVTMLGVVPTLVADWRATDCMKTFNWQSIKLFSSTGEASNPEDMLYLSSLAGYKPIIEYCGGTEIGGAYVSSTLVQPNYLSLCTTPTLGLNFILIDESGNESDEGEVNIIPPSIGLSTELLNADHHKIYYADTPPLIPGKILRRHGDQLKRLPGDLYSILGRVDDTMNLGGIKTSSIEIERALVGIPFINETAAIAISPKHHGPSLLVIFAATERDLSKKETQTAMQQKINQHLNPLFRIHEVVFLKELPKTASNKIMRRVLRVTYLGAQ